MNKGNNSFSKSHHILKGSGPLPCAWALNLTPVCISCFLLSKSLNNSILLPFWQQLCALLKQTPGTVYELERSGGTKKDPGIQKTSVVVWHYEGLSLTIKCYLWLTISHSEVLSLTMKYYLSHWSTISHYEVLSLTMKDYPLHTPDLPQQSEIIKCP